VIGAAVDARVGLGAAVAAWGVSLGAPHPATAVAVALLALALRLLRPRSPRALLPPLALGAVAALFVAVAGPDRAPAAAMLASRIVAAGWVAAALVAWVPRHELLGALAWARVPPSLLELVAIGDRQRHALGHHAVALLHAQRLRLGWSGLRRSLRSSGTLAGLALWRAIDRAELVADALALRGVRGRLHVPLKPRPGARNVLLAAATAAALAGCLLLPGLLRP
jgi:cobalt/nickel transport system permease protein